MAATSLPPKIQQVLIKLRENDPTLTTLDLCFNSLGENGGVAIGEALRLNSTLTTLELQRNPLGEKSGAACVVLKFLARNKRNTS